MQALQNMIDASEYQVDEANNVFNLDGANPTSLHPVSAIQHSHTLDQSHNAYNIPSVPQPTTQSLSPADLMSVSRPTVTPESTSDMATQRANGSTPSSGGGDSPESGPSKIRKRQRNTEAARRYRQRKLDRVSELEEALDAMAKERDNLKLKLAKAEAEAGVLRGLIGK